MIITDSELVCPSGTPGNPPIIVNLARIHEAETREGELAYITKSKAPELMAFFIKYWKKTNDIMIDLRSEKNKAEKALKRRKAELTLDAVNLLKAKNVGSTADTREAIIELDEQYQQLEDTYDQIEACVEFLKGKVQAFESSFRATKSIMGESTFTPPGNNPNLGGDTGKSPSSGWGKAKL